MPSNKNLLCLLGAIGICLSSSAASAQTMPHRGWHNGPVCTYGPDGSCTPSRGSYGYYPTKWRQWPTAYPTAAAKPQPEVVNTPVAEPTPKRQPDEPKARSDEAFEESSQMEPEQGPAPSMTPPFDDQPSQPRREPLTDEGPPAMPANPEQAAPLDSFPTPPSAIQPPDIEDSPPTMPTDDPFKDDPPQPPGSSEPESPRSELQPAATEKNISDRKTAPDWRVTASDPNAPRQCTPASVGDQGPALLPAASSVELEVPNQLSTSGPQKQNPLRLTTPAPRTSQVVRAAHWTSDEIKAPPAETVQRRNPLRPN